MKPILFVDRNSEEWASMWRALAASPINAGLKDPVSALQPDCGEVWQYMGTTNATHEFRHRWHPVTQCREYLRIDSTFLPISANG